MTENSKQFIEFALANAALQLGQFQLKSGRSSPYFFNLGVFNNGSSLDRLGQFYAQKMIDAHIECDGLFGPAYKGIPLAAATAMQLYRCHGVTVRFSANRKEHKEHGEKGGLLGAPLSGRIVVVDDVLTAGTAVREALELIQQAQAKPCALIVAFDRQERGEQAQSAAKEIEEVYRIPVLSIATTSDLCDYLQAQGRIQELEAIQAYQA